MSKKYQFGEVEVEVPEFNFKKIIPIIFLAIIALLIYSSVYSIQADEQGVVLRFGKFSSISESGLHFKVPFIDNVYKIKTAKQFVEEFGFRTLEPGKKTKFSDTNEDEAWTLTNDLSVAEVKWQVQYMITDPKQYQFNVKNVESTIRDISESVMRTVIGEMPFDKVIKEGRQSISQQAKVLMQEKLSELNTGITIKMVQLQSVVPPSIVKDAYNQVAQALQNMEKMINEAKRDSSLKLPEARGQALRLLSDAEGYRAEIVNHAKGETQRYLLVHIEYIKNPEIFITTKMIETMTTIYSNVNQLNFVDPSIGAVPLLGLNQQSDYSFDQYLQNKMTGNKK